MSTSEESEPATRAAGGQLAGDDRLDRVTAALLEIPLDARMSAYGSGVSVVLVTVTDVAGAVGTGFTYTLGLGAVAVATMVSDVLGPQLVGTRAADWDETYRRLQARTRRLGRAVFAPALSALDIAVWDLRAVRAGLPLYRLLGRARTDVTIYGSGRSGNVLTTAQLVEETCSYVADGYPAVKLRIGARTPGEDLARVAAVRAAVGDQVRLMVDGNERLDPVAALPLASRLSRLGIYWIEEPFPAEDLAAHAALARHSQVAVAAGEHLVGRHEFASYLRAGAASVLQPDAALTGGITEAVRICALADAHGTPVAFHSLPELHVQLAMGDPNVCYIEHFPVLDPLLAQPLTPTSGRVTAPDRPGHGILWDEEAVAAYTVGRREDRLS